MPHTLNPSQGEDAQIKSGISAHRSESKSSTSMRKNRQPFGTSAGSTRSTPVTSQPRAAKARLQPQRPQNKSSILIALKSPLLGLVRSASRTLSLDCASFDGNRHNV